jgi:hypothetical protein
MMGRLRNFAYSRLDRSSGVLFRITNPTLENEGACKVGFSVNFPGSPQPGGAEFAQNPVWKFDFVPEALRDDSYCLQEELRSQTSGDSHLVPLEQLPDRQVAVERFATFAGCSVLLPGAGRRR